MKKHWKLLVAVLALLVLLAGAAQVVGGRNQEPGKDLDVTAVKRGDLQVEVTETGSLEPVSQVEVKSKVSGRVLQVQVEEGDRVTPGQVIARLEIPELLSQRDQMSSQLRQAEERLTESQISLRLEEQRVAGNRNEAKASVDAARANLRQLQAGARPEELRQSESHVARAESAFADAARNLQRQKELNAQGFVPKSAVDAAQTQYDMAQSDLDSAKQSLALVRAGARKEELDASQARLEQAEAGLALAETGDLQMQQARSRLRQAGLSVEQLRSALSEIETRVTDATIVSPTSGVVIRRLVEPGSMVISATGGFSEGTTVITVGDLSQMQVNVELNEVDVAKIALGAKATIHPDALRGTTFEGSVTRISPAASQRNATAGAMVVKFLVEVTVVSPTAALRPGMSAAVSIAGEGRPGTLYLPRDAVIKRADGDYVKLVTDEKYLREHGKSSTKDSKEKKDEKRLEPGEAYRPKTWDWGKEIKVVTGLVTPLHIEILDGLKEGDKVLVDPELPERQGFNFGP